MSSTKIHYVHLSVVCDCVLNFSGWRLKLASKRLPILVIMSRGSKGGEGELLQLVMSALQRHHGMSRAHHGVIQMASRAMGWSGASSVRLTLILCCWLLLDLKLTIYVLEK
jgi:hypothetical protein